ncbi:kinase-like protein [Suhomyces tanzawaensis NRRL Y-17324]|uniref:Kinase-like protein n=1 Tax=Suhomyces tanzawaensis NRRL Y-17324 TaxID=984487 RepID=A0A1E4SDW0_9ASCO|nr:kinase-like protein [Suhomyces tanzawaensis NRRL Y-17324]ODV77697.1 kinase-like protein [Suhomyces tanzawaensis NRRL Y-17324]
MATQILYFQVRTGRVNGIPGSKNNFIKFLAAYSIASYLLQFKDRYNGNIMYDDQGHVSHIDFGFCFDIVPGGVKFEVAPFKLTYEMIVVMGGNQNTQVFRWFEELCIKGYLACRPYMDTIVRYVTPMLESGLPCFKETTIKNLRSRFVPSKGEKDASVHMRGLIRKSMESYYTKGYDEFQRLTNGIPY